MKIGVKQKLLDALACAERGDWDGAHAVVQDLEDMDEPLASWIHASLHREEGDTSNARYWYGQAGRPFSNAAFADERRAIAAVIAAVD